jgi:ABC-type transport system involved in cytochrome c biogenesis permease component
LTKGSESYGKYEMKMKDLILGVLAIPVLIPIMIIASIQDKKTFDRELKDQKLKAQKSHKAAVIEKVSS